MSVFNFWYLLQTETVEVDPNQLYAPISGYDNAINAFKLIQDQQQAQKLVGQTMDSIWLDVFGSGSSSSGLYVGICRLALLFAVLGISWYTLELARQLAEDEPMYALEKLFFPLILVWFLLNDGLLMRNLTLGIRNLNNNINNVVLEQVVGDSLNEAYASVSEAIAFDATLQAELAACQAIVDDPATTITNPGASQTGNEQLDCIIEVKQQLDAKTGNNTLLGKAANLLEGALSNPQDFFVGALVNPLNFVIQNAITGILTTSSMAFQWLAEIALFFCGLLGSLACGLSLLPSKSKFIFSWLAGMFAITMTKLCFNIIVGLVSLLMMKSGYHEPMLFAFLTGLCAPILAIILGQTIAHASFINLNDLGTAAISTAAGGAAGLIARTSGRVGRPLGKWGVGLLGSLFRR